MPLHSNCGAYEDKDDNNDDDSDDDDDDFTQQPTLWTMETKTKQQQWWQNDDGNNNKFDHLATMEVFISEVDCRCSCFGFTVEEWESLNRLMEANAAEMSKFAAADNNKNNTGASEMENGIIGGKYDKGEV